MMMISPAASSKRFSYHSGNPNGTSSLMYKNSLSQFKHTVSIRERIIQDVESTETLLHMVNNARSILIEDKKYPIFRGSISQIISKYRHLNDTIKAARNRELFSCGDLNVDENLPRSFPIPQMRNNITEGDEMNRLVDTFIMELLRFLSMKILLESIPSIGSSNNETVHIYQRMPSLKNDKRSAGGDEHNIVPSAPLCDGWKALLLLPVLYKDVCSAMGCDGKLDFEEEAVTVDNMNGAMQQKLREDYMYTLVTYEKLYLVVPDENIWCRLEKYEKYDRDNTFYDGFRDFLDGVSTIVKEKIVGPSRGVPDTILMG